MFSSLDIKPGNITIQTKDLNSKLTLLHIQTEAEAA